MGLPARADTSLNWRARRCDKTMRTFVLSLLVTTAFLAGCADDAAPPAEEEDPGVQFESEVLQLALPTMPRDPPLPGERTLDAAPQWRLGEWWRYRMTDGFTGGSYEFTRVVAGEDRAAGNYLVGFPVDEFNNDVMLFHIPGFGDVKKSTLSYETHDFDFQMLDFPLTSGKQWQAEFEGTGMGDATVETMGDKAVVELITPSYNVVAEYEAEMGEFRSMTINDGTYAQYEVIDHGYGFQGLVRVPHAHDLVFIHGRLAGLGSMGLSDGTPLPAGGLSLSPQPNDVVTLDPGYDRAAFIIAVGGGAGFGLPPPAGYFEETVVAPDGTVFRETLTPADVAAGTELKVTAYGHDFPEGEWQLQHLAAGAGIAFVEGIAYHSIDVDLPSGCVVNSLNAQHHSADCKINVEQAGSITPS